MTILRDHPDAARLLERWLTDACTQASSRQRLALSVTAADPWTLHAYQLLAKAHQDAALAYASALSKLRAERRREP